LIRAILRRREVLIFDLITRFKAFLEVSTSFFNLRSFLLRLSIPFLSEDRLETRIVLCVFFENTGDL